MVEDTPIPPDRDKTPRSYTREPHREWVHASLPPDVTLKPEGIVLRRRILVGSILTMFITSLATAWLPLFNGLLGGTFGGYHAGRLKRALAAAAFSAVAVPATLAFLTFITRGNSSYFFYGLGFRGWILLHVIGTFIGAVAGAASRPLFTGERPWRVPTAVSASAAPPPGGAPPPHPTAPARTVTREEVEVRASPPTGREA